MDDRELLELAAKAAGYRLSKRIYEDCDGAQKVQEYIRFDESGSKGDWNPLENDGDALRLAVKVGINFQNESNACWVKWPLELSLNGTIHYEPHNKDKYAATRRAIVRAAAEIGRVM